jgi:putative aldouronate transport system substrate-binding protein
MQKAALAAWSTQDTTGIWPITTPSPEESKKLASVMNEVKTYMNERTLAFIMGKADIDAEFDKYIATLKSLGIEDAIKINNDALQRYYKR